MTRLEPDTTQPMIGSRVNPRNHMKLEVRHGRLNRCRHTDLGISPVGTSHRNRMKREAQASRALTAQSGSTDNHYTLLRLAPVALQ
jgi:hypothetical protein